MTSRHDLEARILTCLKVVKFWRDQERTWREQGKRELIPTAKRQCKLVEDNMKWHRDQLRELIGG